MNILFWNLHNNSNEAWVKEILQEHDVDIALFAEYKGTSFERILPNLKNYNQYDGLGACEKITLLCKNTAQVIVKREQDRYTLYNCSAEGISYNIAGIHLPAPPASDSNDRKNIIRNIVQDISELELETKNRRTIVIGDFNCNPFDQEVVQKDTFNAVLFRPVIDKQEIITYQGRNYRRFYNPIVHFLSEDTCMFGSIYYSSGSAPLYWNCYDQILVRKELVRNIETLDYIKTINGKKLIKNVRPNENISDHLPLLVSFAKGK